MLEVRNMQTAIPDLQVCIAMHLVFVQLRLHCDAGQCLVYCVRDLQLLEVCRWYLLIVNVQEQDEAMHQ